MQTSLNSIRNSIFGIIVLAIAIFSGWKIGTISIPIGGLVVLELNAPDRHDKQNTAIVPTTHEFDASLSIPTPTYTPSKLSLSNALMEVSNLPSGKWTISQEPSEIANVPLTTLVESGGLSFICQKNVKLETTNDDISFTIASITARSQDLPPQQFQEWILEAEELTHASNIFDILKSSMQECQDYTFVEANNKVRHSFIIVQLHQAITEIYALREEIEPLASDSGNFALYRGTGYVVLGRSENIVFYVYYMTGHSLFRTSHLDQANSVVELVTKLVKRHNTQ